MVLLSFRPLDAVLQDPGALWPTPGEIDLGTYRDVLALDRGRRAGLPAPSSEQLPGRPRHRRADAAGLDPRRVRRQPAGVLRPAADQRAVPRRLLLPGDPAGHPAVRLLHPDRAARLARRSADRLRRAGGGGVDLHAAQLLRHDPGQPRGGGRDRRLHPAAGDAAHQPAAGHAGHRVQRAVHLHDRLERVPLRAAVPRREPRRTGRSRWASPSSPGASRSRPRS